MEGDDDSFAAGAGFFDHDICDSFGNLAFLIGGAAGEHCDLDEGHKSVLSTQYSVLSYQNLVSLPTKDTKVHERKSLHYFANS